MESTPLPPSASTTKLPSHPRKLRRLTYNLSPSLDSPTTTLTTIVNHRLPVVKSLSTDTEIQTAIHHLRSTGQTLSRLIDLHPYPSFNSSHKTPFISLTRSIIYQQLHTKSAAAIYSRFLTLCGSQSTVLPTTILSLSPSQLRLIGVSARKSTYLHDLATKYQDGFLSDSSIIQMDDQTLLNVLTQVKGIGVWSVHMFMIFFLNRPDVLPVTDLGIRKGVQLLFELPGLPNPQQMDELCDQWKPYRSVASWNLWRLVESKNNKKMEKKKKMK